MESQIRRTKALSHDMWIWMTSDQPFALKSSSDQPKAEGFVFCAIIILLMTRLRLVWRLPLGTRIPSLTIFHNFAQGFLLPSNSFQYLSLKSFIYIIFMNILFLCFAFPIWVTVLVFSLFIWNVLCFYPFIQEDLTNGDRLDDVHFCPI